MYANRVRFYRTADLTLEVREDETPGEIDYTSVYAHTDELVQPSGTNGPATAALEVDRSEKVVNVNVQDVCPGRLVEHLTLGTTDRFVMELTIATLRSPGPADLSALDVATCSLPDQYVVPASLQALVDLSGDFAKERGKSPAQA